MSNGKKTGIAVGMVALALLGLTTGCRGGSGFFGGSGWDFDWSALTEAGSAGAPAHAELAIVPTGQLVRVWSETPGDVVALEVLGGDFTDVPPGAYEAGPDGAILAGDLVLEVMHCEGDSMEDTACAPIEAASIQIEILEDGARRVAYRGTSLEGGEALAIDGSFVVGR